jgi:hypothetical protein
MREKADFKMAQKCGGFGMMNLLGDPRFDFLVDPTGD